MGKQVTSSKKVLAGLMGIAAGASYGLGGAVSKIVGQGGYTVMHMVMAQFVCALLVLCVLTLFTKKPSFSLKIIIKLVVLGAISTISSITYYMAIELLSVSSAVALQFQYVWITVVFQAISDRKLPSKGVLLAVLMVIFGTLFSSGLADEFISGTFTADPLGIVFALICALFYAIFIFFNGRIAPEQPAIPRTLVMVLGGFIVSLFCGGDLFFNPQEMISLLPGGMALGLIMSVIPVLCIVGASNALPGGIVAILTSTELPAAVLAGFIIFSEPVTPLVLIGVVLILVSVAITEGGDAVNLKRLRRRKT